ncbi:hypothetical protein QP519_03105 [Weeksella virosa]|nr:hypothetical protein [Weeksella virosa]MDK7374525.1 hypothetical protein [Weeksella virosa]
MKNNHPKDCQHKWKFIGYDIDFEFYRCEKCRTERQVNFTQNKPL